MALGRPLAPLTLLPAERQRLLEWSRRPKTAQALALRARIVLLCAEGRSNTEVARHVRVTLATVGKWRKRFLLLRLDGLLDEPRPGTTRRLGDAEVERVAAGALSRKFVVKSAEIDRAALARVVTNEKVADDVRVAALLILRRAGAPAVSPIFAAES